MLRRVDEALQQASRGSVGDGAARDTVWITHAGVARCVQWLMREGSALPQCLDRTYALRVAILEELPQAPRNARRLVAIE